VVLKAATQGSNPVSGTNSGVIMSRARPIIKPDGEKLWYDVNKDSHRARPSQLELLASVLDEEIEDLLDDITPTQGEVITRLREALDQGKIPEGVYERREASRQERRRQPACRVCTKEGDSTKHHYVNKWILKNLSRYEDDYADRRKNTIPVCIKCHRELHDRSNGSHPIVTYLDDDEKQFVEDALRAFAEEHFSVLLLIARGSDSTYETRLVRDWFAGKFSDGASG
jgi:hypothetical protein